MNRDEKNEIIDEVKRQVTMEMEQESVQYLAEQTTLMRRGYYLLDKLEEVLSHYHHNVEKFIS